MSTEKEPLTVDRKKDHIDLAFRSVLKESIRDDRFHYDPILSGLPHKPDLGLTFLGKSFQLPMWVSSMTGGTRRAKHINHNLAKACHDFRIGMGLGSCRALLKDDSHLADFDVRSIIGDDLPLFGNLGIAQIEEMVVSKRYDRIENLVDKLRLDGLIVHVNPLQEALQPEGDHYQDKPIDTLSELLNHFHHPVIVKEVGQGMGKDSLHKLFQLPLAAVDFGARGGTNFALLEILRSKHREDSPLAPLAGIGHDAAEMVAFTNQLIDELGSLMVCRQVIISGGIRNFLDGYYFMEQLKVTSIYGQASTLLKYALEDYQKLYEYLEQQAQGLALAKSFLRVKGSI